MAYKFQAGDAVMSGALEQEHGITVEAGGLTVTAGGLTVTAGASALQGATCTTLSATGDVDLGDATSVTITATGRFDSDVVPSSDSARDLGTSGLQFAEAHVDTGYIDDITSTGTITTAAVTATANLDIGAYSFRALTFTSDQATGTAPFTVSSTTNVANLNASSLGGATMAEPGAIGGTTAAVGTFTVLTAKTSVVPDAAGGADLGSTSLEWGDVFIADDKKLQFGSGQDATIEYDEDGTDELRFAGASATFEQAVSFDGDMDLGLTTADTITVKGNATFAGTTIANLGTVSAATSITTAALVASADLDIGSYVFKAKRLNADVANGTAPLIVTSTTKVANLNVDKLDGKDWVAPGTIGGTTPGDGNFAALDATGNATLNGNVTLGNATGDDLTFTGRVASHMVPKTDSAYDLGSSALRYQTIYVDSIVGANVAWDVETIDTGSTIAAASEFVVCSSGNGGTVTLPTATAGKVVRVKLSASVGDVILAANTSDLIENAASIRLESTGSAVTCVAYDSVMWWVI